MYIWSIMWLFFRFDSVIVHEFNAKERAVHLALIPTIELLYSKYDNTSPLISIAIKWLNLGFVINIDFSDFSSSRLFNILPGIRYQDIGLN